MLLCVDVTWSQHGTCSTLQTMCHKINIVTWLTVKVVPCKRTVYRILWKKSSNIVATRGHIFFRTMQYHFFSLSNSLLYYILSRLNHTVDCRCILALHLNYLSDCDEIMCCLRVIQIVNPVTSRGMFVCHCCQLVWQLL